MSEVTAAIAALTPVLGPPESEPVGLEGGITNRNYRLRWAGRDCVLRLPGKDTALLGIDRATERDGQRGRGGDRDRARRRSRSDRSSECLVTAYIEGRPVEAEELRGPLLEEVAAALRAIHAGPRLRHAFSPWQRVARYRGDRRAARRMPLPPASTRSRAAAARISAALGPAAVPCHNDLLTANFLHDGERLRILDWEYAGMGDPLFDLANLACQQRFAEADEERLLEAYYGASRPEQLAGAAADAADGRVLGGDVGGRAVGGVRARLRLRAATPPSTWRACASGWPTRASRRWLRRCPWRPFLSARAA